MPAEFVPRPRLIEVLNAGLPARHRMTLVSAPAGFGKTTLLSAWVAGVDRAVAWLSLDEGNNDPVRFWSYLVGALQTIHAGVGETVLVAITNPLVPRMRESPWASGLLDGVNAAALGLMAAVTVQLGRASLVDPLTIVLAIVAAVLVFRFKVNATWLILGGAAAGLASSLVGQRFVS